MGNSQPLDWKSDYKADKLPVGLKGVTAWVCSLVLSFGRVLVAYSNELGHEEMCLMSYANNKGADQPAHLRSLISAFVFAA